MMAEMRRRYDNVFGEGREVRCEIVMLISFTLLNYLGDRLEANGSTHNSRVGN